jgi:hypothetical protein
MNICLRGLLQIPNLDARKMREIYHITCFIRYSRRPMDCEFPLDELQPYDQP